MAGEPHFIILLRREGIHIRDAPPVLSANQRSSVYIIFSSASPEGSAGQGGEAYRLAAFLGIDSLAAVFGSGTAGNAEQPRESCMPGACLELEAFLAVVQASGHGCPRVTRRRCHRRHHCRYRKRVLGRSSRPKTR